MLTIESHLGDVMGNLSEFSAMAFARREALPTDRASLIRLGQAASRLMRAAGEEPRRRDDITFGRINVYPVAYLRAAAERMAQ